MEKCFVTKYENVSEILLRMVALNINIYLVIDKVKLNQRHLFDDFSIELCRVDVC